MKKEERIERIGVKDIITKRVGIITVVGMFYTSCCAGAYGVEEMVPEAGPGLTLIILIVLPFIWALPYSHLVAETNSARPVEGGVLIWLKEAMGEFWFGIKIWISFLWGLTANTVYAVLAVQYLGQIVPLTIYQAYFLKVMIILIFFIVNVFGIKEIGFVSITISALICIAFTIVTIVGFSNMQASPFEPFMSEEYDGNVFLTVTAGLGIGIWMYSGFDEMSVLSGEIEDASKVLPRALMIVIPLMIITYVLPTAAGLGSVGHYSEWNTDMHGVGYHTVLAEYAPYGFSIFFVVVALLGMCSIYNLFIATASRMGLLIADENYGPKALARLSSTRGTPVVSLVIVLIATILLLGTPNNPFDFKFLVLIDVFFTVVACGFNTTAMTILKYRIPKEEYKFIAPGGMVGHWIRVVFIGFFCLLTLFVNGTDYFLGGLTVMFILPILATIGKKTLGGMSANDPEKYPIDPRTGLGYGDIKRLGIYYLALGVSGIIGPFISGWYDRQWAAGYWVTPQEVGWWEVEVLKDYSDLSATSAAGEIWIPGYFETEYMGNALFSSLDLMLQWTTNIGIIGVVIGLAFLLLHKALKLEYKAPGRISEK